MENRFIKVTTNGKKILLNTKYIIAIFEHKDGRCSIRVESKDENGCDHQFIIDEPFEEIQKIM